MDKVQLLKQRLAEIGGSLKQHPDGLGLLGLGSAGQEQDRMDEYSDLDFFAIVRASCKRQFLQDLTWLTNISPVAWYFKNTEDGYKLLFADGVFCEFAIFEPDELAHIAYAPGQFIWRDNSLEPALAKPKLVMPQPSVDRDFLLGELMTNLYVGLCRYHRGEKTSAFRFIQVHAVDRLIALLDLTQSPQHRDNFCLDRRVEQRHGELDVLLAGCMSGINNSRLCARVMLEFVVNNYKVNDEIQAEVRALL